MVIPQTILKTKHIKKQIRDLNIRAKTMQHLEEKKHQLLRKLLEQIFLKTQKQKPRQLEEEKNSDCFKKIFHSLIHSPYGHNSQS